MLPKLATPSRQQLRSQFKAALHEFGFLSLTQLHYSHYRTALPVQSLSQSDDRLIGSLACLCARPTTLGQATFERSKAVEVVITRQPQSEGWPSERQKHVIEAYRQSASQRCVGCRISRTHTQSSLLSKNRLTNIPVSSQLIVVMCKQ